MHNIDIIWKRIIANEGQVFCQIRGGQFSYIVKGNYIALSRTNRSIPKSDFEKALAFVPLKNTSLLQNLVQGPSYVYALLMDERINLKEW